MSNPRPTNPIKPLSVGDVVSTGVSIYRSHLKRFLSMSLIAYLWILVPIYGWAKFAEISGRMSRLTFAELINQPESPQAAERNTGPKKWTFFLAGILVGLIFFGVFLGAGLVFGVGAGILTAIAPPIGILFGVIAAVVFIVIYIRLATRLFLVEVPIAVEDNVDASSAISRSMSLTVGSVGRIQWVVVITFLISLLFNIPAQIIGAILPAGEGVAPVISMISILISLAVSIVCNALIVPFWQVIKAVVYYDLRARREGYGLKLRG